MTLLTSAEVCQEAEQEIGRMVNRVFQGRRHRGLDLEATEYGLREMGQRVSGGFAEAVLYHRACHYFPRVIGIQTGQKLLVLNSDLTTTIPTQSRNRTPSGICPKSQEVDL